MGIIDNFMLKDFFKVVEDDFSNFNIECCMGVVIVFILILIWFNFEVNFREV